MARRAQPAKRERFDLVRKSGTESADESQRFWGWSLL
jgi:hypothetical protein